MPYSCSDRLRQCRIQAGMTQAELAKRCGYTERTIGNYEQGSRVPDYKTIVEMASALKVSPLALAEPIIDDAAGILHTLFRIANKYNLSLSVEGNDVTISFPPEGDEDATAMKNYLRDWATVLQYLRQTRINSEEYIKWISKYPDYAKLAFGEQVVFTETPVKDTSQTVLEHKATHYYKRK